MSEISFEQQKMTLASGQANYRIEILDASNTTFRTSATAVVDFNGDGNFQRLGNSSEPTPNRSNT